MPKFAQVVLLKPLERHGSQKRLRMPFKLCRDKLMMRFCSGVELKIFLNRSSGHHLTRTIDYFLVHVSLRSSSRQMTGWVTNISTATDLDEVLIINDELQKKQLWVKTSIGEENHFDFKLNEQQYQSPTSIKSGKSGSFMDSPATTLQSSTVIGSPDSPGSNSYIKIAPKDSSSSTPIELLSPMSNTSLDCPTCKKTFRGKKDQDQRSNLSRHMRTHTSRMVSCTEPGCDKKFNRSDNRLRHRRKYHSVELDPCGESLSKRRKTADTWRSTSIMFLDLAFQRLDNVSSPVFTCFSFLNLQSLVLPRGGFPDALDDFWLSWSDVLMTFSAGRFWGSILIGWPVRS